MKQTKLGVLADEFFDHELGGMGGFGWAARQVAACVNGDPDLDLVFLTGAQRARDGVDETTVHGTRLLLRRESRLANLRRTRRESIELLLTIDYNLDYRFLLRALPRVPVVVWVRAPRTPEDDAQVASVRIPGAEHVRPQGLEALDTTSLAGVVRESRLLRRRVLFAAPAPHLAAKLPAAYGVAPDELHFLPNVIELGRAPGRKAERPRVAFLGRLDPCKRPWVLVELARRLPHVEFLVMGRSHFAGPGSWTPDDVPPNVQFLGHLDDERKEEVLGSAWALVNTSVHEGLAVSFLEALACGTPLISCQDPVGVVSRFGTYVGRWDGTGLDGVPAFAAAIETLVADRRRFERLGCEGRAWVRATHTREAFLAALQTLRAEVM